MREVPAACQCDIVRELPWRRRGAICPGKEKAPQAKTCGADEDERSC
jgi:hypothetical protein